MDQFLTFRNRVYMENIDVFYKKRQLSNCHQNAFIAFIAPTKLYLGITFYVESLYEIHFFVGST